MFTPFDGFLRAAWWLSIAPMSPPSRFHRCPRSGPRLRPIPSSPGATDFVKCGTQTSRRSGREGGVYSLSCMAVVFKTRDPRIRDGGRQGFTDQTGMESVGFSPTRQTLLAPSAKHREVFGETQVVGGVQYGGEKIRRKRDDAGHDGCAPVEDNQTRKIQTEDYTPRTHHDIDHLEPNLPL